MSSRGPAWEAFVADLGCDYDDDPNSIMAYEAGRKDARAEGVAEGLRMARDEARRGAASVREHDLRKALSGFATWCEARAKEVER